jgi:hypothetical protein
MGDLHGFRGEASDEVERGSGRKRLDPWVVVVSVASLVIYPLHGFQALFSRDLGVYAYGARQVLAGQPPYVGIVNRAGPLAHLLPVPGIVAARVLGKDELFGMRVWYMLVATACVAITYLVGRHVFSSRLAGLAAAATMLGFQGFADLATSGPREKTPMVLFILAAIWALSYRRWLLTGVGISLATLTLQTAFLPLLAAAVVAVILVEAGSSLRALVSDLVRLAVGGAIPVVVVVAYFAAYGAVHDLLDWFLLMNLRYTRGTPFTSGVGRRWASLREGYGASLWLLLAGLVLVLVIAVIRLLDPARRHDPASTTLVALAVATVGSLLWMEVDFDTYPDAFTVLPLAALGIGAGIAELDGRLPPRGVLAVAAVAVVVPTALAVHYSVTVHDTQLQAQRRVTNEVLAQVPQARIWSIGAPQYLVLARRANPTRYQLLRSGLGRQLRATWPGGMHGFVLWNRARHPDLVVVSDQEMHRGHWISILGRGFVRVGHSPGAFWFGRSTLGPDLLRSIRRHTRAINASYR